MFVLHLLRGFGTDLGESYINRKLEPGRNQKVKTVAVVMKKPSKSTDSGPIVMIYAGSIQLIHTNLHAKNQENPPRGLPIVL